MSNESINKFQNAVTRATAAIGVKASVFVGSAKLKTQIGTFKNEIEKLSLDLGKNIFRLWNEGKVDRELIDEKCTAIKKKYENINKLNTEIEKLEREEANIMGVKTKQKVPELGKKPLFSCPNCNETYDTPVKFCRKCGTKI